MSKVGLENVLKVELSDSDIRLIKTYYFKFYNEPEKINETGVASLILSDIGKESDPNWVEKHDVVPLDYSLVEYIRLYHCWRHAVHNAVLSGSVNLDSIRYTNRWDDEVPRFEEWYGCPFGCDKVQYCDRMFAKTVLSTMVSEFGMESVENVINIIESELYSTDRLDSLCKALHEVVDTSESDNSDIALRTACEELADLLANEVVVKDSSYIKMFVYVLSNNTTLSEHDKELLWKFYKSALKVSDWFEQYGYDSECSYYTALVTLYNDQIATLLRDGVDLTIDFNTFSDRCNSLASYGNQSYSRGYENYLDWVNNTIAVIATMNGMEVELSKFQEFVCSLIGMRLDWFVNCIHTMSYENARKMLLSHDGFNGSTYELLVSLERSLTDTINDMNDKNGALWLSAGCAGLMYKDLTKFLVRFDLADNQPAKSGIGAILREAEG